MAPRAHAQVHVGPRQAQLDEEHLGHALVIVLPGVHDPLIVPQLRQGRDHRRGLHEVWPRAQHVGDRSAHRVLSVHRTDIICRDDVRPAPSGHPPPRHTSCRPARSRSRPRLPGGTWPRTRSVPWSWPREYCHRRCAAASGSPGLTDARRPRGARGTGTGRWPRWTPRPIGWPRSAWPWTSPRPPRPPCDGCARPIAPARCWPPAWPGAKAASPTPSKRSPGRKAAAPAACAPASPPSRPSWRPSTAPIP